MKSRREKLKSVTLFFLALISHLPFLMAGYGREEDAWAQALNAKKIWETSIYEVSRLPGHPLYELLLAGLWPINHTYFFFNLLSTIATSTAVVFFYRIAQRLDVKSPFTLSLTFAFVPVVFIAGNFTIDYNFALCFILASFTQLINGRYVWAGILLGIATGFRISSLAFLLPFSILLWNNFPTQFWIRYWVVTVLIAFLGFLPPTLTYGLGFLNFHKPPFTSWASILYEIGFGIWGVPLLIALVLLALNMVAQKSRRLRLNTNIITEQRLLRGIAIVWLLQLLVFIRLPFKAEFFIPAVPFLLLLCGVYLRKLHIRLLAGAAFLSSFMLGFDYANPYRGSTPSPLAISFEAGGKKIFLDPIQGPAILDLSKRTNKSLFVNEVLSWGRNREESAWVVAGWYWPEIMLKEPQNPLVEFDYYSTEEELKSAVEKGQEIFYLPEINEANAKINAHYLADSLGQPLNLQ